MSIRKYIRAWERDGTLVSLRPQLASDRHLRTLLLSKDVAALLSGPWENEAFEARCGALRANLEVFVRGDFIELCTQPFKHRTSYMGLLDKKEYGVWDIRSQSPSPGLRVFGGFAETDCFVALTWRPRSRAFGGRDPLADRHSGEWDREIQAVRKQWKRLFRSIRPHTGEACHELVSENASFR